MTNENFCKSVFVFGALQWFRRNQVLVLSSYYSYNEIWFLIIILFICADLTNEIIDFFLEQCRESPVLNANVKFLVLFCPMGGKIAAKTGEEGGAFPSRESKYKLYVTLLNFIQIFSFIIK